MCESTKYTRTDSSSDSSSASDSFEWVALAKVGGKSGSGATSKSVTKINTPRPVRRARESLLRDKYSLPRKRRAPPPPAPNLVCGWVTVCGSGGVRRAARVKVRRGHTAAALAARLRGTEGEARLVWRGRLLSPQTQLLPLLHASPHLYLFLLNTNRTSPTPPSLLRYGADWESECGVCLEKINNAVIVSECLHGYCAPCLRAHAAQTVKRPVPCPMTDCPASLSHRELRALLTPEAFEHVLERELNATDLNGVLRCATPNCNMWVLIDEGVKGMTCSLCGHHTCAQCHLQHSDEENCAPSAAKNDSIGELEAMECSCGALVTREWGCEWVQCARCRTELCWATKGPRWGPGGRGDTTAGCRCGVDGRRCHPSCRYCH